MLPLLGMPTHFCYTPSPVNVQMEVISGTSIITQVLNSANLLFQSPKNSKIILTFVIIIFIKCVKKFQHCNIVNLVNLGVVNE